jgi:aerobic-type carbon monoxide dehydrogenase small subunit (CoxS/CutS family)
MSLDEEDDIQKKNKVSRRTFIAGVGAGVVVAAIAGAAAESLLVKPTKQVTTSTVTSTITVTSTGTGTGTGTGTTTSTTVAPSGPVTSSVVTLTINGSPYTLEVQSNWSLLEVLRNQLNLFSVKEGCSRGECGACTVIMDAMAVNSCQILAIEAQNHQITTLEGIGTAENLHPLQQAWITYEASQCGYCTPGMILQAKALLDANPKPTIDQIRAALAGNLCICGNYKKITNAVASVGGAS